MENKEKYKVYIQIKQVLTDGSDDVEVIEIESPVELDSFDTLYDYKGNKLPSEIINPKIIVLPKNQVSCLVLEENNSGFKIAQAQEEVEKGLVDLMVWEMG